MNRTTKFRIWSYEHKHFADAFSGSFAVAAAEYLIFGEDNFFTPQTKIGEKFCFQQWTGLNDKNGKEIYEGDWIIFQAIKFGESLRSDITGIVQWHENDACFSIYTNQLCGEGAFLKMNKYELESSVVIGNIFENPDLLNT